MDKNTVFVKTKDGEAAVRQRTRLVQRNLRNILIMVDGHAAVADLAKRFGDEGVAHAALAELEAGGFIEESINSPDFDATLPPEGLEGTAEELPVLNAPVSAPPAPKSASVPPPVVGEIPIPARQQDQELPPPMPPQPEATAPHPRASTSAAATAEPGWIERIRAMLAGGRKDAARSEPRMSPERHDEEERPSSPVDLEPISHGRRTFGWTKGIAASVFGLAVLAALTLLLYPFGRHLPDIERQASAALHDPVKIGGIGFSLLPRPHIVLSNVRVGAESHMTIPTVRAVPDFLSLLGERTIIRELEIDGARVKSAGLGRLAQAGAGANAAEIRHVSLKGLSLSVGDVLIGGLDGQIMMNGSGSPEKILLRNAEGTLDIEMQPMGDGFRLAASGSNWKAPFMLGLTFQRIEARGELRAGGLNLNKVDGSAFEGLVEGKASLDWANGAVFAGSLEFKHVNSTRLLTALGSELSAEGELTASVQLDAKSGQLARLAEALRAGATFEVKRGAVKGFDLAEAARKAGHSPTLGGETKFEQLSGVLQCDQGNCRLGSLRLSSGLFKAGGNIEIARGGKVDGVLNVEIRSSAATLRMPLTVGGTTKDPQLTPGLGK